MNKEHQTCREKTSRGNIYHDKQRAKKQASGMRRATGVDIRAYRCISCGNYHLGSHTPPETIDERKEKQRAAKHKRYYGGRVIPVSFKHIEVNGVITAVRCTFHPDCDLSACDRWVKLNIRQFMERRGRRVILRTEAIKSETSEIVVMATVEEMRPQ